MTGKANKSKKIVFLTDMFEPEKFGGAEIYLYNLIKEFKKKYEYELLLIARSPNRKLHKNLNINLCLIPLFSLHFFSLTALLCTIFYLNIRLLIHRFDLIIINHPMGALYTLFIPTRKKIIIFHSPWCYEYKYRKKSQAIGFYIRLLLEKYVYNNIKHIVTLSNYTKRLCIKLFKTTAKIDVIYPSIDSTEFDSVNCNKDTLRKQLNLPADKTIFFTARSMIPRTGIDILVESINLIKKKVKNCLFIIAGSGSHLKHYKDLVKMKDLFLTVKFTGFLERKKLIKYFYASDCFLLPSFKLEGFGLVIPEALYCNLPIIATPVGAIPEVLKGIEGCFISKSKTPVCFAESIINFLESKNSIKKINLRKDFFTKFNTFNNIVNEIIFILK